MRYLPAEELDRILGEQRAAVVEAHLADLWHQVIGEVYGDPGWSGMALVSADTALVVYAYPVGAGQRVHLGGPYPLGDVKRIVRELSDRDTIEVALLAERLEALHQS